MDFAKLKGNAAQLPVASVALNQDEIRDFYRGALWSTVVRRARLRRALERLEELNRRLQAARN